MLKNLLTIASLAGVLSITSIGHSQALPTATGHGSLQAGGGVTLAMPDYAQSNIKGVSAFGDFDLTPHIGIEADIHYVSLITPSDVGENTYEIGPRFVFRRGRFAPYAKAMGGLGRLNVQLANDNPGVNSGNYFMYSVGGGLDILVRRRIVIRAIDAEIQHWPSLGNGLSPYVFTVGAAYRFR